MGKIEPIFNNVLENDIDYSRFNPLYINHKSG